MPEILEVEQYRRAAAPVVGRRVAAVEVVDRWYLRSVPDPVSVVGALAAATVTGVRRRGKLLLVDFDVGLTLGLRFGMTGRLVVDGISPVDRLEYGPGELGPAGRRFGLRFVGGGTLWVEDPRRLGRVEVDPDEGRLGPDAATASREELARALAGSSAPVKVRLMDQRRLAGLGNLLTDELLWRAGLDPARPAGGLDPAELGRLHRTLSEVLAELGHRGGSHCGDLQPARRPGGRCPRDGTPLERRLLGGRRTYSCPVHQR